MELSKRLQKVASFVPKGKKVADIGSDHAYLPLYLVNEGIIDEAIAGEVVKGPFEAAEKNVRSHGRERQITVRLANGLRAICEDDEVQVVTIAGMGGRLITTILEDGSEHLKTVERLILQPNIHSEPIRQWAVENSWKIIDEAILEEDDHIYEILVLERGEVTYTPLQLLVGPKLLIEKNATFQKKWQDECRSWQNVLQSLEQAKSSEEVARKKEELRQKIEAIEKVMNP